MHYMATQVAGAAARALGKLGAAALPHVHRILTCATDDLGSSRYCSGGRNDGMCSFADALIELLPHLTSAQRLQEVVTQLEEGNRPDVLPLGLAAAPYAEAIAAYADVPKYGKEVCACCAY